MISEEVAIECIFVVKHRLSVTKSHVMFCRTSTAIVAVLTSSENSIAGIPGIFKGVLERFRGVPWDSMGFVPGISRGINDVSGQTMELQ